MDDDDEVIDADVDDLVHAAGVVNGGLTLHHYLRQNYSTQFKLDLISRITDAALARNYRMIIAAAMFYCEVAVVERLRQLDPEFPFIELVVLDSRARDANVLACLNADATGELANAIVAHRHAWLRSLNRSQRRSRARPVAQWRYAQSRSRR